MNIKFKNILKKKKKSYPLVLIKQTLYCFTNNLKKDNLHIKLHTLTIKDITIKQVISTKYLVVLKLKTKGLFKNYVTQESGGEVRRKT